MKKLLFCLCFVYLNLVFLLLAPSVFSAVFLPEISELAIVSQEDREEQRNIINELISTSRTGDYIQIDDMRFKTNDLIEYDGFSGRKWPLGVVYYTFDANVSAANKQIWLNAAAKWSTVAGLTFTARTTEPNYIHVLDGSGNWSYVGMIGNKQELSIYNWDYLYIVAHEIGHALGLSHEQSRSDRNSYVTILTQNIEVGNENNFTIKSTTNYGVYDFDSVLHYSKSAFSSNGGNTIEPLPAYSSWLNLIGQRDHLSTGDMFGMAQRYPPYPPITCDLPETPNNISYPVSNNNGGFNVSWASVSEADSYTVHRSTTSSFNSFAIVYSGPLTSFDENGLADGTYFYRVRATNSCGNGSWRNGSAVTVTLGTGIIHIYNLFLSDS